MNRKRWAAVAVLMGAFVSASAQAEVNATSCWREDEVAASRIGDLQLALMVDTLKCRLTRPASMDSYNSFMAEKADILDRSRRTVQAHFVRQFGEAGVNRSTDFDTKRSNDASAPTVNVHSCDRVEAFSRMASKATEADLLILAETVGRAAAIDVCPAAAPVKPAAMVIEVWRRPAPPAVVAASQPPAVALAAAEAAPQGLVPVTSAKATAGLSNGDAVKALQAAVLALSQVAETLQAGSQTVTAGSTTTR